MNHQPFKDWLLSDDQPSLEQLQALQEHLHNCPTCRQLEPAWGDVLALIKKTPIAIPHAGFTDRWHARLAAQKQRRQRRQAWILMGIVAGIAILLSVIFGAQVAELLSSPAHLILVWISRLTTAVSIFFSMRELLSPLAGWWPGLSLLGSFFAFGMLCFISVAWLAAYRRLSLARRIA